MAFIIENFVSDRRLQLGFEEYVRPMTFGTRWSKIRIGVRYTMNGIGTFTAGGLTIGACQGSIGYMSPVTLDYIGACPSNNGWQSGVFTYAAGPPAYYTIQQGVTGAIKRGAVVATGGANGTTAYATASAALHSMYFMEVVKGSPNYTVQLFATSSIANAQADVTAATFYGTLEIETAPTNMVSLGGVALAYTGGAGLLDSVSVMWGRSVPTVEIANLSVCRFL